MSTVKAFFSYRFCESDREIVGYFKTVARWRGLEPVAADEPRPEPITHKVRSVLEKADCFVGILTCSEATAVATSAWVNQEVGMAFERGIPLVIFAENSIDDLGLLPSHTEIVRFDRGALQRVLEPALRFFDATVAAVTSAAVREQHDPSDPIHTLEHYADCYDARLLVNLSAKQAIAQAVVNHLRHSGASGIMLDSGSVTYVIADQLIDSGFQIPIVTNNLAIVSKLHESLHQSATVLPGKLDARTLGAGGNLTAEFASKYLSGQLKPQVDTALIAANAIDPDCGFSADAPMFSEFRAAMWQNATKAIFVLQGEKFFKPVIEPVITQSEWVASLARRTADKTVWAVCHQPVMRYSASLAHRYLRCAARLRELLPPGHFIELGPSDSRSSVAEVAAASGR